MKQYDKAISNYDLASKMCPNRFEPLYAQYKIYTEINDIENKEALAYTIQNKLVKIKSNKITTIINEVTNEKNNN